MWDALGGVSVLAAGTGEAVQLRDLWDPTEVVVIFISVFLGITYSNTKNR